MDNLRSPTTSQKPSAVGHITSGVTPAAMESSSRVILSGRPELASKESEKSSLQLPATTTADPEHVSRPETKTINGIFYTLRSPDTTSKRQGLRAPTGQGRATSDSWMGGENSASSTHVNTEMINVSSDAGENIKEMADSPGLLRPTGRLNMSLESGTNSSPGTIKSTTGRRASADPTTEIEIVNPFTHTLHTTGWARSSKYTPGITAGAQPGSPKTVHVMDTAPNMMNNIVSKATKARPDPTKRRKELDYYWTTDLREENNDVENNSIEPTNVDPSKNSSAVLTETNKEGTNIAGIITTRQVHSTKSLDTNRLFNLPEEIQNKSKIINKKQNCTWNKTKAKYDLDKPPKSFLGITKGFTHSAVTTLSRTTNPDYSEVREG